MSNIISLAILDDHQSIIDGYRFRLRHSTTIQVVATALTAADLESMLQRQSIDVLLMDVNVPVSATNPNAYPILEVIPRLRRLYPKLVILVISMFREPELIQAVLNAGARGYIYKTDYGTIQNLEQVILTAVRGPEKEPPTLVPQPAEVPNLSPRQLEILALLAAEPDLTTKAVARRLNISHSTTRNLLSKAYGRLDVPNKDAAIRKMQEIGIFVATGRP